MRYLVSVHVEPMLRARGFAVSIDETDDLAMLVAYVKGPTAVLVHWDDREGRFGVEFAHTTPSGVDAFTPTITLNQVLAIRGAGRHAVPPDGLHDLTAERATEILIDVREDLARHAADLLDGDWFVEARVRALEGGSTT